MTGNIKTYTLADMTPTSPNHENSKGVKLFNRNGLEVVLQGNFDGHRQRVQGSSPVHEHLHDELVYLLEGDYGRHNRKNVDQLASNVLRIRAGTKHGGDADGIWISVKPKEFRSPSSDSSRRTIGYNGSQLGFVLTYSQIDPELITPGLDGVMISVEEGQEILNIRASNTSLSRHIMSFEFS